METKHAQPETEELKSNSVFNEELKSQANRELSAIMPVVNKLNDIKKRYKEFRALNFKVPQVIVVGEQSAGKSSLLKMLIGFDIFPEAKKKCTICPLTVELLTRTEQKFFIEDSNSIMQEKKSVEEIRGGVKRIQDAISGSVVGVSSKPIKVRIEAPNVASMTLVDLPGLMGEKRNQKEIAQREKIEQMLETWTNDPNTIVIMCMQAKADMSNDNGRGFIIRNYNKKNSEEEKDDFIGRIIPVLTKADAANDPEEVVDTILDKSSDDPEGQVFKNYVLTRSGLTSKQVKSIGQRREEEKAYFSTGDGYERYSKVDEAGRCGTGALLRVTQEYLLQRIQESEMVVKLNPMISKLLAAQELDLKTNFSEDPPEKQLQTLIVKFNSDVQTEFFGNDPTRGEGESPRKNFRHLIVSYMREVVIKVRHERINPLTIKEFVDYFDSKEALDSGISESFKRPIRSRIATFKQCMKEMLERVRTIVSQGFRAILKEKIEYRRYRLVSTKLYMAADEWKDIISKSTEGVFESVGDASGHLDTAYMDEKWQEKMEHIRNFAYSMVLKNVQHEKGSLEDTVRKLTLTSKVKRKDEFRGKDECEEPNCNVEFKIFGQRKHHCRMTGFTFCDKHARIRNNASKISSAIERIRICGRAYYHLKTLYDEGKQRAKDAEEKSHIKQNPQQSSKSVSEEKDEQIDEEYDSDDSKDEEEELYSWPDSKQLRFKIVNELLQQHCTKVKDSFGMLCSQVVTTEILNRLSGATVRTPVTLYKHLSNITPSDEKELEALMKEDSGSVHRRKQLQQSIKDLKSLKIDVQTMMMDM